MKDLPDDFQLDQLNAALSFVTDFSLAIDIGAHRGIWTKFMLGRFDRVVAIEPTELAYQIDHRAKVIKAACGGKPGNCSMRKGERNTGQSYVGGRGTIPIITIDSLGLRPGFIKIDVEGMEYAVIAGAAKTIKESRPTVMIEENFLCARFAKRIGDAGRSLIYLGATKVATFHMLPEKDENKVFQFK